MSVQRLSNTPWFHYVLWHLGRDEWSFQLDGLNFRVVNEWFGTTKLVQGETVLAQGKGVFEVTGSKPFLQATIRTNATTVRSIAVYFKAILKVHARVEVDGREISNGFV